MRTAVLVGSLLAVLMANSLSAEVKLSSYHQQTIDGAIDARLRDQVDKNLLERFVGCDAEWYDQTVELLIDTLSKERENPSIRAPSASGDRWPADVDSMLTRLLKIRWGALTQENSTTMYKVLGDYIEPVGRFKNHYNYSDHKLIYKKRTECYNKALEIYSFVSIDGGVCSIDSVPNRGFQNAAYEHVNQNCSYLMTIRHWVPDSYPPEIDQLEVQQYQMSAGVSSRHDVLSALHRDCDRNWKASGVNFMIDLVECYHNAYDNVGFVANEGGNCRLDSRLGSRPRQHYREFRFHEAKVTTYDCKPVLKVASSRLRTAEVDDQVSCKIEIASESVVNFDSAVFLEAVSPDAVEVIWSGGEDPEGGTGLMYSTIFKYKDNDNMAATITAKSRCESIDDRGEIIRTTGSASIDLLVTQFNLECSGKDCPEKICINEECDLSYSDVLEMFEKKRDETMKDQPPSYSIEDFVNTHREETATNASGGLSVEDYKRIIQKEAVLALSRTLKRMAKYSREKKQAFDRMADDGEYGLAAEYIRDSTIENAINIFGIAYFLKKITTSGRSPTLKSLDTVELVGTSYVTGTIMERWYKYRYGVYIELNGEPCLECILNGEELLFEEEESPDETSEMLARHRKEVDEQNKELPEEGVHKKILEFKVISPQ